MDPQEEKYLWGRGYSIAESVERWIYIFWNILTEQQIRLAPRRPFP
jgi:hypothetical protein